MFTTFEYSVLLHVSTIFEAARVTECKLVHLKISVSQLGWVTLYLLNSEVYTENSNWN